MTRPFQTLATIIVLAMAFLNTSNAAVFGEPRVIVRAPDNSRYQHLS